MQCSGEDRAEDAILLTSGFICHVNWLLDAEALCLSSAARRPLPVRASIYVAKRGFCGVSINKGSWAIFQSAE